MTLKPTVSKMIYGHRNQPTFDDVTKLVSPEPQTVELSSKRSHTSIYHLYIIVITIQTLFQLFAIQIFPCPYMEVSHDTKDENQK